MTTKLPIRYSYDNGFTWSSVRQVSVGMLGQRNAQAWFWNLGVGRSVVIEVYGADPVFTGLVAAYAEVIPGND